MNALQLTAPSRLEVVDLPTPEPGPDEVRVEIAACGICGSDLHGMDGSSGRRQPPLVMGHEASGTIAALGAEVTGWNAGDRVTFDSTVWCGECGYCRAGRVNLCDHRQVIGVACPDFRRDGCFAESVVVPARILHRLPEGLDFAHAAFAEPVGVALHAVTRAMRGREDFPPRSALVVGSGLIGLLVIQALRRAGVEEIVAVDLSESRLELARELGATRTCRPGEETGEHDLAFEVVGAAATFTQAVGAMRKGGRLVLVGNLAKEASFPLQAVVTREIDVLGSCAIAGEYPEALAALAAGEIRVEPLVSDRFALEDGAAAFERAARPDALKVLVTPR